MSSLRPLPEIQADIAAAAQRLTELQNERALVWAGRRGGIVADFDAGLARPEIAAKWRVDYSYVAAILHRAGRTGRRRDRSNLTPEQRTHYDKLLRLRVASGLARAIAVTVVPTVDSTDEP
jgi:hypothetical protein